MRNKVVPEYWDKYITSENWEDKTFRLRKRWRMLNQEDINFINGDYFRLFTVLHRKYGLHVDEAKLEILEWLERGAGSPTPMHKQAEGAADHMHGVSPVMLLVRSRSAPSIPGEDIIVRNITRTKDEQKNTKAERSLRGRKRVNQSTVADSAGGKQDAGEKSADHDQGDKESKPEEEKTSY